VQVVAEGRLIGRVGDRQDVLQQAGCQTIAKGFMMPVSLMDWCAA